MSRQVLESVLDGALAKDPTLRAEAEAWIESAFKQAKEGFLLAWVSLINDTGLEPNRRLLAATQAHIRIYRSWSRLAFAPGEKQEVRERLVQGLNQCSRPVFRQTSAMIARIAFSEAPGGWPELLPQLMHNFLQAYTEAYEGGATGAGSASAKEAARRSLETLKAVFEELKSKVIGSTRKYLGQVAPEVYNTIFPKCRYLYKIAFSGLDAGTLERNVSLLDLEIANVALRLCRNCLVEASSSTEEDSGARYTANPQAPELVQFLGLVLRHSLVVIQSASALYDEDQIIILKETSTLPSETFLEMGISTVYTLVGQENFEGIVLGYSGILENPGQIPVQVQIHALLFYRAMLAALNEHPSQNVFDAIQNYFSPHRTLHLTELLMARYLMLTAHDLEEWSDNPEGWKEEQSRLNWEYDVKPCAEQVLSNLFIPNDGLLAQWINLSLLPTIAQKPATDLDQVRQRDVEYAVFGQAQQNVADKVSYADMIEHHFWPIVGTDSLHPILRRRIALVIGQWAHRSQRSDVRKLIWQILSHLLETKADNDIVVRLTVTQTMAVILGTYDCHVDDFMPVMNPIVDAMINLFQHLHAVESKLKVLNTMSKLVEMADIQIVHSAEILLKSLPILWQSAGDQDIVCKTIILAVNALVIGLKEKSQATYPISIPLLNYVFIEQSQMVDDALKLLSSSLQFALTMTPELLALFPHLLRNMKNLPDEQKLIIDIINSYILLAPEEITSQYGVDLFDLYGSFLDNVSFPSNLTLSMVKTIENIISSSRVELWLAKIQNSGLLQSMVLALNKDIESAFILTAYLGLFARMLLAHADPFGHVQDSDQVWEPLIGIWIGKFANIAEARDRKLHCMGLTKLLQGKQRIILDRLKDIVQIWSEVLHEVKERPNGDAPIYNDDEEYEGQDDADVREDEYADAAEAQRRKRLKECDPVHTIHLGSMIRETVLILQSESSGQGRQCLDQIDPLVLSEIASLL